MVRYMTARLCLGWNPWPWIMTCMHARLPRLLSHLPTYLDVQKREIPAQLKPSRDALHLEKELHHVCMCV